MRAFFPEQVNAEARDWGVAPDSALPRAVVQAQETASQLGVPVLSDGKLLGVLFVDGARYLQCKSENGSLDQAVARHLQAAVSLIGSFGSAPPALPAAPLQSTGEKALQIRRYALDSSIFVDGSYLIKGVAGAVLWKLLRDHQASGRTDFCYRELRLDASLKLPDIVDNLGARLILLQRRLEEQCPDLGIEKIGRGRFRLLVRRPVVLQDAHPDA